MKEHKKKSILILIPFILLLLAMIIVPLITPCIPKKYSFIGILLSASLSICNRISSLKNTSILQALNFCFKSKRKDKRMEFENNYFKMYPTPILKLTSLDELKTQYEKEK